MNIYVINAGGYYTVGTAVVSARTVDHAVALANEASEYHVPNSVHSPLTYNSMNVKLVGMNADREARVLSIHEWGMPHLPSRGSGKSVTF